MFDLKAVLLLYLVTQVQHRGTLLQLIKIYNYELTENEVKLKTKWKGNVLLEDTYHTQKNFRGTGTDNPKDIEGGKVLKNGNNSFSELNDIAGLFCPRVTTEMWGLLLIKVTIKAESKCQSTCLAYVMPVLDPYSHQHIVKHFQNLGFKCISYDKAANNFLCSEIQNWKASF